MKTQPKRTRSKSASGDPDPGEAVAIWPSGQPAGSSHPQPDRSCPDMSYLCCWISDAASSALSSLVGAGVGGIQWGLRPRANRLSPPADTRSLTPLASQDDRLSVMVRPLGYSGPTWGFPLIGGVALSGDCSQPPVLPRGCQAPLPPSLLQPPCQTLPTPNTLTFLLFSHLSKIGECYWR